MATVTKELFIAVLNPCDSVAAMVREAEAAKEVAKIVAWLRGVSDANNGSTIQDRRLAYQIAAATFADAIEAGEYRNDA